MRTLPVYDPAMCCDTGICGPEVDSKLVQFAADLDWLKTLDVDVTRFNLSQEPAAFVQNDKVKSVLDSSGVDGLPAIMLGDKLVSPGLSNISSDLVGMQFIPLGHPSNSHERNSQFRIFTLTVGWSGEPTHL